jgi:nitrogen fixation NifU-like protein
MVRYQYSEDFLWHFENTRNVGTIANPDGIGEARSETSWCGDVVRITIRVKNGVIEDIRFRVYGCAVVIACGSMVTEWVKGKSVAEAKDVSIDEVALRCGHMNPAKKKCIGTVIRALMAAIENYHSE